MCYQNCDIILLIREFFFIDEIYPYFTMFLHTRSSYKSQMTVSFDFNSSLWLSGTDPETIEVIDQRYLPFESRIFRIRTVDEACYAISEMVVRGAPLIGVTAAFGMYLACLDPAAGRLADTIDTARQKLNSTRPTAVNLFRMTQRMFSWFSMVKDSGNAARLMLEEANRIRNEEIESCRMIGVNGFPLIEEVSRKKKGMPVNILTHCNAGWLACVQWGTATAPIYMAHREGIPLHVWVDETRPRNQGARLTAFELGLAGIPHTVIPDNAGGHLMQHGKVDMVIVGSDRTTRNGDVANKIGTYLKAVAAADNNIPFYAALPTSTFDPDMTDGIRNIPVEERSEEEVACIEGWNGRELIQVKLIPENSAVANFGFDVTPARLVTLLITEKGLCAPRESDIVTLLYDSHEQL